MDANEKAEQVQTAIQSMLNTAGLWYFGVAKRKESATAKQKHRAAARRVKRMQKIERIAKQAASASASAPLQRGPVTKPIQPVERSLQQRIKKDHNTFLADPFNEAAPSQGESNKSWPRLRPITFITRDEAREESKVYKRPSPSPCTSHEISHASFIRRAVEEAWSQEEDSVALRKAACGGRVL